MFSFNYYTHQYHFWKKKNWHLVCLLKTVWIRGTKRRKETQNKHEKDLLVLVPKHAGYWMNFIRMTYSVKC